jgi:hypothetical protein
MTMTELSVNIDAEDLGIIRVALIDALAEAESRRRALDGLEEYAVGLASVTHRLEVLESVLSQIRAEPAERIACKNCGHTLSAHDGKYFKQRPCGKCDCVDMVIGA